MNSLATTAITTFGIFGIAFILDAISRNKQAFLNTFKTLLKPMKRVLFVIALLLILMVALGGCKKETIIIVNPPCKPTKNIHPDSVQKWFRDKLIMVKK